MTAFEWYYFDIHDVNGMDIVFTLHTRPFMSVFDISIFDLFIYRDNRIIAHRFFTKPQNRMATDKNPLEVNYDENNFLRHSPNGVELKFDDPAMRGHLTFKKLSVEDNIIEAELYPFGTAEESFIWKVLAPYCQAEGRISVNDMELEIQGRGYHDYNAGSISLHKTLKGWSWRKFYYGDTLLILGMIQSRTGDTHQVVVRVDPEAVTTDHSARIQEQDAGILVRGDVVNFDFTEQQRWLIDDVPLLVLPPNTAHPAHHKVRELLAFITSSRKPLKWMARQFNNTRYRRFRRLGQNRSGLTVQSFDERMDFDD